VELNALTLGSLILAFVGGSFAGWLLRRPKTIAMAPPDVEREKTLAEARHQGLLDDIEQHLSNTQQALIELADHQSVLATELRGELRLEVKKDMDDTDPLKPPRDYADSRGQLL
tara:strand:+ start:3143 stop:3484 length:342 start_codon:yes stop_codon:yes gene_type:complete